jgi:hypothetical protein
MARPITETSARNLVVITASLEGRQDCGQRISLGGKDEGRIKNYEGAGTEGRN